MTTSQQYKAIGIGLVAVVALVVCMPLLTAGTLDPCEAAARIVARKLPKSDLSEPWAAIADELGIKAGAAVARSHGIVTCYKLIPEILTTDYSKLTTNRQGITY